jgi:hypothetical protein
MPTSTPSPTSTADGQENTSLPLEYIVLPTAAIAVAGVVAVVLLKKARASNRLQRHSPSGSVNYWSLALRKRLDSELAKNCHYREY